MTTTVASVSGEVTGWPLETPEAVAWLVTDPRSASAAVITYVPWHFVASPGLPRGARTVVSQVMPVTRSSAIARSVISVPPVFVTTYV